MKLYKYRNFESSIKIDGVEVPLYELIIKDSSLYFAPISSFNDPFDCQLTFKDTYTRNEKRVFSKNTSKRLKLSYEQESNLKRMVNNNFRFKDEIIKNHVKKNGVLSLSSICNNILMWSHYSSSHTGLVFEFEPKYEGCFFKPLGPIKVEYKETYQILSHAVTDLSVRKQQLEELITTKYIDWKYENEYRVIDLDYIGNKQFKKDELTSIIFGLNTSKENINRVKQLCKENGFDHVKFKQTAKVKGRFELDIIDLKN